MKRLRISRCTGQLLSAQSTASSTAPSPNISMPISGSVRAMSAAASMTPTWNTKPRRALQPTRWQSTAATSESYNPHDALAPSDHQIPETSLPSPAPQRALASPKLSALHSRLSLPSKLPLQTLARCLVDPSADANPHFNNANLALLGTTLISYHASERLLVTYPRLPMEITYEAMRAHAGPEALTRIAQSWGVEQAAAPGGEVDPGLLQYSINDERAGVTQALWGYVRKESSKIDKFKWRRGVSSRTVLDDEFGDAVHSRERNPFDDASPAAEEALSVQTRQKLRNDAHANFVRALVGALYAHSGREAARSLIDAHVLARRVDFDRLFSFRLPARELAMLCAREGFDPPVARLLSETGRRSRTPVYVVGVYSGSDKLGEGSGSSLDFARVKACMNALKSWYLYSPGKGSRVPSDMLREGAKAWEPAHIDMGEIV